MTSTWTTNVANLSETEQEATIVRVLAQTIAAIDPMNNPWTSASALRLAQSVRDSGYTGSLTLSEQFATCDASAALYGIVWYLHDDLTFTVHY